jgi:hypothetical protein
MKTDQIISSNTQGTVTPNFEDVINEKMKLFKTTVEDKKPDECNPVVPIAGSYTFDNDNELPDNYFNVKEDPKTGKMLPGIPCFTGGKGDYTLTLVNSWSVDLLNVTPTDPIRVYCGKSYYTFNLVENEEGAGKALTLKDIINLPGAYKVSFPPKSVEQLETARSVLGMMPEQVIEPWKAQIITNQALESKQLGVLQIKPPTYLDSSQAELMQAYNSFEEDIAGVGDGFQEYIPLNEWEDSDIAAGQEWDDFLINPDTFLDPDPSALFVGSMYETMVNISPVRGTDMTSAYWSGLEGAFGSKAINFELKASKKAIIPPVVGPEYALYKFPSDAQGIPCYDGAGVAGLQAQSTPKRPFYCGKEGIADLKEANRGKDQDFWFPQIDAVTKPWSFFQPGGKYVMFLNGYGVRLIEEKGMVEIVIDNILGFFRDTINYIESSVDEIQEQISGFMQMDFPSISDQMNVVQCFIMNNVMPDSLSTIIEAAASEFLTLEQTEENVAKEKVIQKMNQKTIIKRAKEYVKLDRMKTFSLSLREQAYIITSKEQPKASWKTIKDALKLEIQNESLRAALINQGVSQIETINLTIKEPTPIKEICQRYYINITNKKGYYDLTVIPGFINLQAAGKMAKAIEILGPTQNEVLNSPELNNDKIQNNKYFNTIKSIQKDIDNFNAWAKPW